MPSSNKTLGAWGEFQAACFLEEKGFEILERNFSFQGGEVDIIAIDRVYIIFVEVKLRKNNRFAEAREFVTLSKQKKIRMTAEMFLLEYDTKLQPRFDIIEVYAPNGMESSRIRINHFENAFE